MPASRHYQRLCSVDETSSSLTFNIPILYDVLLYYSIDFTSNVKIYKEINKLIEHAHFGL